MNKKLGLAVASALLAVATSANAGIKIPAGDWTVDIGGNVNAYYTNTSYDGDLDTGSGNSGAFTNDDANNISTGLLPSAFGIGAKTRQNDLDVAFQFTFFTGADSNSGSAFGGNSLNIRQAFLTFGDASWGSIKLGRDLGIFGSDAILSDMTLLGVGAGAGPGGTSTLGRIGSGYIYADWKGQITYSSPNWNGFTFSAGITEGLNNTTDVSNTNLGYEGKVGYEWAGDVPGKVWASYISKKNDKTQVAGVTTASGYTTDGFDLGAKVSVAGFGLVGYYYQGDGLSGARVGPGNLVLNGGPAFGGFEETDDDGGYVQATYTIPGPGTKLGLSYGTSKSAPENGGGEFENKSWVAGVYHPLTKHLNIVAEYTANTIEDDRGAVDFDGDADTIALGAILFF
jgi:predicted porin